MRSGFVALVGRPNVGKSTLLNAIIGKKVAITSARPQTTRNMIQGIYNDSDTQIVFVDTPGIHKPNHKLGKYLNEQAYYSMNDVDVILLLVDVTEKLGRGDQFVIDKLKEVDKPVLLILNKIDCILKTDLLAIIDSYKDLYHFQEIIPVSALKRNNVEHLIEVLKSYLPDHIQYYSGTQVTNQSLEFLVAEIVREKLFELMTEEVPHSLTCVVESFKKNKKSFAIQVLIIVDRDSLKKIIIGKQGNMLKKIGIKSRKEIEVLLGARVYLSLYVKTIKKWRDKEKYLSEFGFHDF